MSRHSSYQPVDQLFLWMLTQPENPKLIGELNLMRNPRGVSLRYAKSWREHGFGVSEDLPLNGPDEFFPVEKDTAPGAVDDARPDRWGEQVIRVLDKPLRLSLLEYLYFAGDDRFGALGVSVSNEKYEPCHASPLPVLGDVAAMQELVRKVLANESIPEEQKRLISPGVSLGGARPKALLNIEGEPWVIKFSDGEPIDTPLIEHASMTLASQAAICVAQTIPIRTTYGHAVAIKRFDRIANRRVHALSARVALQAAEERFGYPELALLLRRRGVTADDINIQQMRELFRRMVFNILIDNTDDHEKNHALLVNESQQYELSPAYDVLPSGQALGYQQMRVGLEEADSTLSNAMSLCSMFGLTKDQAATEISIVAKAVNLWKEHFMACGVTRSDIEMLAEQIDRPFLKQQREEALR
ncbi:MAG: HipA domain-containing protein [Myxococcaceae bacterium]